MMAEGALLYREIRVPVASNDTFCLMSSIQHLITEDYVWAMVPIVLWMAAVIYGTFNVASAFSSLSLRRSFKELTMERHSQLDVLDVFRVVAIIWVIVNHTGSEGRIDILDRLPSAEKFKSRSAHLAGTTGHILHPCANYFDWSHSDAVLLFFIYIAAGPITKRFLPRFHSTMISACGVSGIAAHLTLLGNWQSTPTCLGYLWYLGLDMQLHIMAPFLLHALYKRPAVGKLLCVLLIVTSMFIRAGYCSAYEVCHKSDVDIPFISYPGQDPATLASIYGGLWEMYARPCTKCGPFILGLLLGTASTSLRPSLDRHRSRYFASTFFALCVAVIYAILPQYWFGDHLERYNLYYTATFRTIFAIGVCGMIWAFISRLERKSTSYIWSILARLTYNTYLLHMPVIYLFNYSQYLQQAQGATELIVVVPFVALLSFAASSVFYFFVEAPIGYVTSNCLEQIDGALMYYFIRFKNALKSSLLRLSS
ncbi:acyltransferase [Cooperia oncophora]